MTFLALAGWQAVLLASATAATVITLFFLKVRHPRAMVGSLLLWQRVLEERSPETLIERLRRLLSLLLVLLIALLIALALGRPLIDALTGSPRRIAIVLDASPSLATRTADGERRWDHALAEARHLVEAGRVADRFLIADTNGRIVAPWTENRAVALRALDGATPSATAARFPSIAADTDLVYFISDGVTLADIPETVVPISVYEPAANIGITAFEIRSIPATPSIYEVYLEVANYADHEETIDVSVGTAERSMLKRTVTLPAGDTLRQVLEIHRPGEGGEVRATVDTEDDALAIDNVAYGYLPAERRLRVQLVTDGNEYLETLLRLDRTVEVTRVRPGAFRPGSDVDVYIFDRYAPPDPPDRPALFFRPGPAGWLDISERDVGDSPASADSSHPVMRHVAVSDVQVTRAQSFSVPDARVVASAGTHALITTAERPVRMVLVGFDLEASDFPTQLGFPIFIHNVMAWFVGNEPALQRVPGLVDVPLADARVLGAAGAIVPATSERGRTVFMARQPGLFTAIEGDTRVRLAVNATDRNMSDVNHSRLETSSSAAAVETPRLRQELWVYMLLAAFLLMALEWWTYHRRITV